MSDVFGIDQQGQKALEDEAALNPLDFSQVSPTFWRGALPGIGNGIMRGGAKAADFLLTAGSMLDVGGNPEMHAQAIELKETLRKNALDHWTPQPGEVGTAGRVLGGLGEMVLPLTVGAGNPTLLLGSATLDTGKTLIDQGVDANTATGAALITDVSLGVGFRLPFLGSKLSTRVASGVAGNVAVGLPANEGQKYLLEQAGYQELAQQYGYSSENFVLDALMGAAFGGVAHLTSPKQAQLQPEMTPEQVDALLSAKNAQHFQHDTAPGVPADAKAAVAHQDALGTAITQLLHGEKVNVSDAIAAADFIVKPPKETPITRALKAEYPDMVKPAGLSALPLAERQALPYDAPALNDFAAQVERKYNLPTGLINALKNAGEKSGSKATSPKGARGVMQFMPENLQKYGVTDPTDPLQLIDAAGRYLADTSKQYGGNVDAMIADYNGGPKQAARVMAGKEPTAKETRAYLGRVRLALNDPAAAERIRQIEQTTLTPEAKQTLGQLYQDATRVKPVFDATLAEIANQAGGDVVVAPLKGVDRAAAKASADYGGDAAQVKDLVRGTIMIDEPSAATAAVDLITQRFEVVGKPRNLFDSGVEPVDGYRDAKFNVRVDGHVAEIQVNMPEMLQAKEIAHPLYEERSAIERRAIAESRKYTDAEVARIDELNAQMRTIFRPAWEAAQARALGLSDSMNSASDSGDPLRLADSGSNTRGGTTSQAAQVGMDPGMLPSDTGTPSTSNSSSIASPPRPIIAGRKTNVTTERGMTVPTRYAVTDIARLVTSHADDLAPNPAFPAELQPRDRARAASEAQIARIENALNPELLGASARASDGAPIVGADLVVESGNARTIALRRAYGGGKADGYRAWLIENAEQFGLDPAEVAKMDRPALVRVGSGDYARAEFARQANESAVAQMSVTEIAKSDAARIPDLMGLVTNEDGSINPAASASFIQGFMAHVVSPSEHGAMMTADGKLSQQGLQRIRNAVFAKGYGDADVVALMAESTDANIKNVLAGMLRAAPAVARLRDLIDAGARHPIDVSADLVAAVKKFSQLRADGMKVPDFLAQGALFDSGISPEVRTLLIGLEENSRAPKRVAEMVGRIVDQVDRLGDPRQTSMFGDTMNPAAADLVNSAIDSVRKDFEVKPVADLFDSPEIRAARQILDANPDARIMTDDGREISVREAIKEVDDAQVAAKNDAQAFDAAITCYMGNA